MKKWVLHILIFIFGWELYAGDNRPYLLATRISESPKIDGLLDDRIWLTLPIVKEFTTHEPVFGRAATENTEVRIAYDNLAIYVSARMYDSQADKIVKELTQRDQLGRADRFELGLDTYNDDITGYKFIVSAANSQLDGKHLPGDGFDLTWDGVWESAVQIDANGWSVELKIPYTSLRFPKKELQDWGIQFVRFISRKGELSSWAPSNPNINSIVPQWGDLQALQGIQPPMRLSFTPYLASYYNHLVKSVEPLTYSKNISWNGGVDLKYGFNESFTLDATLVPDFGQVQSDNVVRNLSPYEVSYEERRPFFTEASDIFSRGYIFYSRRIGGRPKDYFSVFDSLKTGEVIHDNPGQVRLYNAIKFSGKTVSNLGIGLLNAVAAPSFAELKNENTGELRKVQTDVLTNYNVFVLDQSLPHASSISLTNTSVLRNGNAPDANVTALRFNFQDKNNVYEWKGRVVYNKLWNENLRKSEQSGFAYDVGFAKIKGEWIYGATHLVENDTYNPNDLGLLFYNNTISNSAYIGYNDYKPKGNRRYWQNALSINNRLRYKPLLYQSIELNAESSIGTKYFQQIRLVFSTRPVYYYDYFEPRTEGMKYHHAPYWFINLSYQTDTRKKYQARFGFNFGESPIPKDPYIGVYVESSLNFKNHFQLNIGARVSKDYGNFGFVDRKPNGLPVFGFREIVTVSNTIEMIYVFNTKINLHWRIRHYWNKLNYLTYHYLLADGNLLQIDYPDQFDENFQVFNSDFVFTWQFAPGSFLNLIWKNGLFQNDFEGKGNYFDNLNKIGNTPKDNIIGLKMIYYLDFKN